MSFSGRCFARALASLAVVVLLAGCATGMSREELAREYQNIGNAWLELDRPEEAAEYFVRAVDLNPELADASFNLARAWLQVGRVREAIDVLEELAEEDPRNTLLLRTLGVAYYRIEDIAAAREAFETVLEENERDVDALYNLGVLEAEEGNRLRSISLLERARELDDGHDIARAYGLALYEEGRYDAADEPLSQVAEEYPEDPRVIEALARIAEEREDYAEAVEGYERLIDVDPENAGAHFRLAYIRLAHIGETEAGIAGLRAAIDRGFDDEAAFDLLLADLEGETYELVEGILLDENLLPGMQTSPE